MSDRDDAKHKFSRQLKAMADDPDGMAAMSEFLGMDLRRQDPLKKEATVGIIIPSYRGLTHRSRDAGNILLRHSRSFCDVFSMPIYGSSLISWVRNDILAKLYTSGRKFTHVLYMDDDMEPKEDALINLLRREQDLVGSLYTCRTDPPIPNVHVMKTEDGDAQRLLHFDQANTIFKDGLMTADPGFTMSGGTGLVLVTKEVLDRVSQFWINCEYEKFFWKLTDEQVAQQVAVRRSSFAATGNGMWFQLLPRLKDGREMGEDTSFFYKAALCGFKPSIDTDVRPGHSGEYVYTYRDFEAVQDDQIEKAQVNGVFSYRSKSPEPELVHCP